MYWIIRLAVVTILLSVPALAIISPSRSVIMPAHLKKQADIIRGEYGQGYWAQHMVERRIMRENAASTGRPLTPSIDTAFIPVLLGRYVDVTERFSSAAFQALLFDGPNPSGTVTDF